MAQVGPSGPLFPPDTQRLSYEAIGWGLAATISCCWVAYSLKKWRKTRYDWKSDHLYLALTWILMLLGYLLNLIASVQWMTCKYPYIYRVPSPITSQCLVFIYVQVGGLFLIIGQVMSMAFSLHRFLPAFVAIGMKWIVILHKVSNFLFSLFCISSSAIELAILFGLYDQDISLDFRSDKFDRIHMLLVRVGALATGTIPMINSLLVIRYILGALREIRSEIRKGKQSERILRNRKYLTLTYVFIISQFGIIIIVGVISLNLMPQYYSIALLEQRLVDYLLAIVYHSLNQLSTISFSKVLQENSANSVQSVISTRWVEYSSSIQFNGQSGSVSITSPSQSIPIHAGSEF